MAYTPEDKRRILDAVYSLMEDGHSVLSIFQNKMVRDGCSRSEFKSWVKETDEEKANYARAIRDRALFLFDELQAIADTTEEGTKTKSTKDGVEVTSGDMVEHRKLKIDTRKWILSRMFPADYGDRITAEISNPALDELRKHFPNIDAGESVVDE